MLCIQISSLRRSVPNPQLLQFPSPSGTSIREVNPPFGHPYVATSGKESKSKIPYRGKLFVRPLSMLLGVPNEFEPVSEPPRLVPAAPPAGPIGVTEPSGLITVPFGLGVVEVPLPCWPTAVVPCCPND